MEQEFRGYCRTMRNIYNKKIDITDINGSYIDKFKKYTQSVLELEFNMSDSNWEDLKAISEIRNILVHADGDISKDKHNIISNFCKRHKLFLLQDKRIVMDLLSVKLIIILCKATIREIYSVAVHKFPGPYSSKKRSKRA
jgi:hypothetical protein